MKKVTLTILSVLVCVSAFAAVPAKIEPVRATEIIKESKETKASAKKTEARKIINELSVSVAGTKGTVTDVENAIRDGGADLLVVISEAIEKKETKTLDLISYLSKTVKNEADGKMLAELATRNLSELPGAKDFVKSVREISKSNPELSLTQVALKAAEPFAAKVEMTKEVWLKKLLECV